MFLKTPRPSTDQRVRSLLQKAARRGYEKTVGYALKRLDLSGDRAWVRSRCVVITFEECWPLASQLVVDRDLSSRRTALLSVSRAAKNKDAAGLGALAYAYGEGDRTMLDCVPDQYLLKLVSEALKRPREFFQWVTGQSKTKESTNVIVNAQRYLPVATWQWDKACILAGALLATLHNVEAVAGETTAEEFPYWVALDRHTPEGKEALGEVAKQLNEPYRQLIWASFYFESACVNRLLPSVWWEAEKNWRLRRAGLSANAAGNLWLRARPLIQQRLEGNAASLKDFVETPQPQQPFWSHGEDIY